MRLILQRVSEAGVRINGGAERTTGAGLAILVGLCGDDDETTVRWMAEKAVNLRIFGDEEGNLNRSLLDTGGDCLIVSNFTLYANCKKGRRPSFVDAARPEQAEPLYRIFVEAVKAAGAGAVATGEFGAEMTVRIHNDGPVTIILDSDEIMPQKDRQLA